MSKVPVYFVARYACTELEEMRTMLKTRDFSGLSASIERLQMHATAMEDALCTAGTVRSVAKRFIKKKGISDERFRKLIKKAIKGDETW